MTLRTRFGIALLAVLTQSLAPTVAYAQSTETATSASSLATDLTGQALVEYDTARILYGDRDYTGALVKFQHAYELSHDPRLLWNIAACEKNLRRYSRMLRLLERYEREGGNLLTEQDRAEANELANTVRRLVSSLIIEVSEPGATVSIDGELIGQTPLPGPVLVDLGKRRISVEKPGFKEHVMVQDVPGASEVNLSVTLQKETRESQLIVSAPGADEIFIDGKLVGKSHFQGPIASGRHSVRVNADGSRPYFSDLLVRPGETRTVDVNLERGGKGLGSAFWIASGLAVAAGLGVGAYFLFRPNDPTSSPMTVGTFPPGRVELP